MKSRRGFLKVGVHHHCFWGTLGYLVRHFCWLTCCIAAVGVHHTWFSIGTRGTLMAFADGAMLCVLSIAMHWAHRKIMMPNDKAHRLTKAGERDCHD